MGLWVDRGWHIASPYFFAYLYNMALPNGDLITTPFDPQMAYPSDRRMQVDTLNSRDSMSMFIRWEGMEVYVLENSKKYILQGGRSNEYWKESGTGTGTGGTTFVGQFPTADLLPTSGRSAGDYAFVGTDDDFVQYNWDNIGGAWKEITTGVDEFLELNDVEENSFTGKGNAVVRVTPNSSGLKFYNPSIRINGTTIPVSTPDQSVTVSLAENAEVITITGSGGISLRGVYQSYDNKEITIRNEQDEGNVTILHENLSASVDDRFDTGGEDLVLEPNQWIKFLHSKGRWRKQYGEKDTVESTLLSDDDFYIGYAYETIEGVETRVEVIHDKTDKDVIITDSGNIIIDTNGEAKNFILTGEVNELRGIESATGGKEISIVNSTGKPVNIIQEYSGAPSDSQFSFGYTLDINEKIYVKDNTNKWDLSPSNQIAFSDHLDSVNAQVSVGSDGLEVITGIYNKFTGKEESFKQVTEWRDGTPMDDSKVDGVIYRKVGDQYFADTEFLSGKQPSIKKFGAIGDGVNDDSDAIQRALNLGGTVLFPPGSFGISKTIEVNLDETTVTGLGSRLIALSPMDNMLSVTSDRVNVTWIELDGQDMCQRGILITGGSPVVEHTHIHSIKGHTISAQGILVSGANVTGARIVGNRIAGIHGVPNGTIGDGPGAARGITFQSSSVYSGPSSIVENNYIEQIDGEEGDGIHINFSNVGIPYGSSHIHVSGNKIRNCNRRAIKIQASNVSVLNNTYTTDFSAGDISNHKHCIDVINGENITITGNNLDARFNIYGIGVTSSEGNKMKGAVIYGNTITTEFNTGSSSGWDEIQGGILVSRYEGVNLSGNLITGGTYAINLNGVSNSIISNNIIFGGISGNAPYGIIDDINSKNNTYRNNTGISEGWRVYFLEILGNNNIIDGTSVFFDPDQTFRAVRIQGDQNIVLNTKSNGDSSTNISDNGTNTIRGNNYIQGTGGHGGFPFIGFKGSMPTTGFHYNGELILNSNPSLNSPFGWICTSQGVPGNWIPLPKISNLDYILEKPRRNRAGSDYTFISSDLGFYTSFTGSSGDVTINADVFSENDEVVGEVFGQTKTLIAGSGMTLRGDNLTVQKNQRFSIKFSSPTDALVTVYGNVAAASSNAASNVGATYSQTEVQAILTELRDLKSKMRTAGLLAT